LAKTYGNLLLNTNKLGNFINALIVNQSAIHVEHSQTLVSTEHTLFLQDNLDIPLALKAPDTLVLPQIREGEIIRVRWGRESDLHNAGMFLVIQTAVRSVHALVGRRQSFQDLKEVRQTHLGDIRPVKVIQRLGLWRGWLAGELVHVFCWG